MSIDLSEFEEFDTRWRSARSNTPRVAIQRRGTMSLNRAAFRALGEPEAIVFLYNRSSGAIALRAATKDVRHAAPIRKQGASDSYLVSAKAFLDNIDFATEDLIVFGDIAVGDGVLVLDPQKSYHEPRQSRSPRVASGG